MDEGAQLAQGGTTVRWKLLEVFGNGGGFGLHCVCALPPNDSISATRRTGRKECNHSAMAGSAGEHGRRFGIHLSCGFPIPALSRYVDTPASIMKKIGMSKENIFGGLPEPVGSIRANGW